MKKPLIVIDDEIPFVFGVLEAFFEVHYLPGAKITNSDLKNALALLVRTRTRCDKTLLKNTPVQFIATATVGEDHLDTEYLIQKNIKWTNAAGANSQSVVTYTWCAILEILKFKKQKFRDIQLGIIGHGKIGSTLYQWARALEIPCLVYDPFISDPSKQVPLTSFENLLKQSDIVSLHVPLTSTGPYPTKALFAQTTLEKMKKNAFLINTSRGEVVDNQALFNHLQSHPDFGAVLDVWEKEPHIHLELLEKVFIGTPHIAGYSLDGKANASKQAIHVLGDFFGFHELKKFKPVIQSETNELSFEANGEFSFYHNLFTQIYPILRDNEALKKSPSSFESLRKHYPKRRDPSAYSLKSYEIQQKNQSVLKKMGFVL